MVPRLKQSGWFYPVYIGPGGPILWAYVPGHAGDCILELSVAC